MTDKTETKANRIKDARKITDPAKLDTKGMIAALLLAWDVPANPENKEKAVDYLIRLGYGKLRATTKWARENPTEPKPKRTPKARKPKAPRPVKAADPVAAPKVG